MPLLILQLSYDSSSGLKAPIVLNGSVPKQPMNLVHYQIDLDSADSALKTLWVKLPFLNNFDVNTNYEVSNAFPVFNDPTSSVSSAKVEYEWNPAKNIDESINGWNIYDQDGNEYTTKSYTVTLVLTYRRAELL